SAEKITSVDFDAGIKIHFHAAKVYIVMGNAGLPINVKCWLNGNVLTDHDKGKDVIDSQIHVDSNRLYSVIDLPNNNDGILEIQAQGKGLQVYTFTFGS